MNVTTVRKLRSAKIRVYETQESLSQSMKKVVAAARCRELHSLDSTCLAAFIHDAVSLTDVDQEKVDIVDHAFKTSGTGAVGHETIRALIHRSEFVHRMVENKTRNGYQAETLRLIRESGLTDVFRQRNA